MENANCKFETRETRQLEPAAERSDAEIGVYGGRFILDSGDSAKV